MSTSTGAAPPPGPHLGDEAAALADGQLRGAARDRALGHVSVCGPCRDEVAAQRRLKTLVALPETDTPASLQATLLGLTLPGPPPPPAAHARGLVPHVGAAALVGTSVHARGLGRTRSLVLTGVAVGVIGGGLSMAVTRSPDAPAGAPGAPTTEPPAASVVVARIPDVVRTRSDQGQVVPLVADLLSH